MSKILILADTRQQKDKHITDYFNKNNILWQRATLNAGDYMAIKCDAYVIQSTTASGLKSRGIEAEAKIYKDYSTIIDTKKDILEMAGNLCRTSEHERIKNEIMKARLEGNKSFIFLVADSKIKIIDDLAGWTSSYTKVKGETLAKVMRTMQERYGCQFIFCKKNEMGAKIVELLS